MSEIVSSLADADIAVVENELEQYGTYASITRGCSMWPVFKTHRDVVIIKKPDRPLKKYDIVLYAGRKNRYVMHRIIAVRDDEYIIRGDNTYVKEHVKKECVIGILTDFNRKGKHRSVDAVPFKIYSRVWHYLYPVRFFVVKAKRLLGKIKRKLFR